MRKFLCWALVLTLCLGMLTGCGFVELTDTSPEAGVTSADLATDITSTGFNSTAEQSSGAGTASETSTALESESTLHSSEVVTSETTSQDATVQTAETSKETAQTSTETSAETAGTEATAEPQPFVLPEYAGQPYVTLNGNEPYFSKDGLTPKAYEYYAELDHLGRCVYAEACIGTETMPTEDRGNISSVKPTAWQSVQYDIVDGGSLYNRCHLIGFQLTGENANVGNLITGTRYMNVSGMLSLEDMVADYIRETGNHVKYRATPFFEGNELLARGVIMEAYSVEDNGEGICFNVFAFNVQPGIIIDYANGESKLDPDYQAPSGNEEIDYVVNTNTGKFHYPTCASVRDIKPANRKDFKGTANELAAQGYSPCGSCKPVVSTETTQTTPPETVASTTVTTTTTATTTTEPPPPQTTEQTTETTTTETTTETTATEPEPAGGHYILNTNTMKFHHPTCGSANKIKPENKGESFESRDALIAKGYSPCGSCKP